MFLADGISCDGVQADCFAERDFCWVWCIGSQRGYCYVKSKTLNGGFSAFVNKIID